MSTLKAVVPERVRRGWLRATGRLKKVAGWTEDQGAIARYEAMRADNEAGPVQYRAGVFWKLINEEFKDLIWAGELKRVRDAWFTERFSSPPPQSWEMYCHFVQLYYNCLLPRDHLGFLRTQSDASVGGNSRLVDVDGRPMSVDFLLSVEDAYAILDAWTAIGKTTAPQVIIELGAGYGRLAYVVRKMLPNSTYIILDLPEALACSSSWLSAALPGEVVPYEETRSRTRFGRAELQSRRIWTLGTHQIEHIEDDAADVFANIRSFAEMPKAVIENYFAQLNRIDSGVFYTVQRKTEDNKADGQVVRESTYPIPPHWRQLYYRDVTSIERSFFQAAYATRSNH